MDLFENLPAEDVYAICRKLDNRSLNALIKTSTRNWEICHDILDKRKEEMKKDLKIREKILYPWLEEVFDDAYTKDFIDEEVSHIQEIFNEAIKNKKKLMYMKCVKAITEEYIRIHDSSMSDWQIIGLAALTLLSRFMSLDTQLGNRDWLDYYDITPQKLDYDETMKKFITIQKEMLNMKNFDNLCDFDKDDLKRFKN